MFVTEENQAKLLAALYNASKPLGLGMMSFTSGNMTEEVAVEILKENSHGYFDYLKGLVMKIHLGESGTVIELNFCLYDRDNGPGAGERACKGLEV